MALTKEKLMELINAGWLDGALKKVSDTQVAIQSLAPIIDCYGDSNTRYYLGDSAANGEIQNAFSSYASVLSFQFNNVSGASFVNMGTGALTAEQGDSGFSAAITNSPNVVTLGFGTNNIRLATRNLNSYLASMESLIEKVYAIHALPIILTIPDFNDAYAEDGVTGRAAIVSWNAALVSLASRYNVPIIDVYSMFNCVTVDRHTQYYNEATNWRHFSKYVQSVIGFRLCEVLSEKSIIPAMRNEFKFSLTSTDQIITSTTGTLSDFRVVLINGGNSAEYQFNAIKLLGSNSSKLTIIASGQIVTLGFYGRTSSGIVGINITDRNGTVMLNTTFDTYSTVVDNLYMPVKKFTFDTGTVLRDYTIEISATNTKNASSSATDIYFSGISCGKIYGQ